MKIRINLLPVPLAVLLIAIPAILQAQVAYETLSVPGAATNSDGGSFAFGISGTNIVGGYVDNIDGGIHGFLYNDGAFNTLNDPNSGYGTIATGISGNTIVGWYVDDIGDTHGFIYTNGTFTTLDEPNAAFTGDFFPDLPPGGYGYFLFTCQNDGSGGTIVSGISGTNIVGWYVDASDYTHGFLYNGSTYTTLDDPNGVGATYAQGISNNVVVGYYETNIMEGDGIGGHGFLYSGGSYSTIDVPGAIAGAATSAQAISGNNIVGWYDDTNGNTYGFNATIGGIKTGSLKVNINPPAAATAGAQWCVDGGIGQPSGTTVSGLPVGNHIITFSAISGWTSPSNQIVSITASLTNTATGIYLAFAPQITTVTLPNGTNGFAYNQQLSATGGQLPYNWFLKAGSLPSALTLATNGLISGIPTTNGSFNLVVEVTNAFSLPATQALTLLVGSYPNVVWIQPTNGSVMVAAGSSVTFTVSVSGTGPFSYQWQQNGTNLLNGIITTVAGGGGNYPGNGGAATNAKLYDPEGVAVDANGNLFIADSINNRICEVALDGIITTVAGNGYGAGDFEGGYSGDGGAATNAELYEPSCVAVDVHGNLYFSDEGNVRIREVAPNGIITTVAGNGTNGFSGDGGAATNAEFHYLQSVAVDSVGDLFIADEGNMRIREVRTNGIINTVAGNGQYGYSGDGGAATNAELYDPEGVALDSAGNLFIADYYNGVVRRVGTNGIITTVAGNGIIGNSGDGGAATNAELHDPIGVATDSSGNLFIVESDFSNRIRCVETNGIITTVAGNGYANQYGEGGFSGDGGAATNAELNWPNGAALDGSGNLFIADEANQVIRKVVNPINSVTGPTLILHDVGAGNAGVYNVVISSPFGTVTSSIVNLIITLPPTIRYTANPTNGPVPLTVQFVSPNIDSSSNTITSWNWNFGDGSIGTNQNPSHVYNNVGVYQPGLITTNNLGAAVYGYGPSITVQPPPPGVTIQPTNNPVAVAVGSNVTFSVSVTGIGPFTYQWQLDGTNLPNGIITTVAGNGYGAGLGYGYGAYSGDGQMATNAELNAPQLVTVDATGNLFIGDQDNNRIRKVGTNGMITTVAGNGTPGYSGNGGAATNARLYWPIGAAVDSTGNLFVADFGNNVIRKVGTNGIITTVAGNGTQGYSGDGGAATNAELYWPCGIAVDAADNLFIGDEGNNRIRMVSVAGIITTVAGNGTAGYIGDGSAATSAELHYPYAVAVDTIGNLYIGDYFNNVVRKVETNGIITTVAGNGGYGYSGDGGAAINAGLDGTLGVALDATGNLYIGDEGNNRIREVSVAGIITTVAGNGTAGYIGDGGAATNAELNDPDGVAVDTSGNLFVADSGNNVIRKVVTQGPSLVLNNVGFGNAGSYDVVVSGPYGSVTSSVVNVTVTISPLIMSSPQVTASKTNFTFILSGPAGSNYVLQASTNLSNWIPVSTSSIPSSGTINISNAISGSKQGFYRVHLQ